MNSRYDAVYEKRRNYDPFSNRESIDSRTALEDILGAFLGELILRVTRGIPNWEVYFVYIPSIRETREAGFGYAPKSILAREELNRILRRPLRSWNSGVSDEMVAWTIRVGFQDVNLGLEGLVKLSRALLNPRNEQLHISVNVPGCHQNAPQSMSRVNEMIYGIADVRNPSTHREINSSEETMKFICRKVRDAYGKICDALPALKDVFCQFTPEDETYLAERYCPLLQRILDELDKKLGGAQISPETRQVSYKDLGGYNIFLDESALSSGHMVTLNKLTDEMQVFIYGDSLSSVAKVTTNPDAMTKMVAKNALNTFYLSKQNIGLLENRGDSDQQSILTTLRNNPGKKFFVITENRSFAAKIRALGNPRHIAARTCNNRGEFIIYRSEDPNE